MHFLPAFLFTFLAAMAIGSPTEWLVHRFILHSPRNRRKGVFIKKASYAHNDVHHGAFSAPSHYYLDLTNEGATIHFSAKDVSLIALVAAGIGTVLPAVVNLFTRTGWSAGDTGFLVGIVSGIMLYYALYETMHHYMHVLGERRMRINKYFGDLLQQSADGNLRFSKPLLDRLCTEVENHIDRRKKPTAQYTFRQQTMNRLQEQLAINVAAGKARLAHTKDNLQALLDELTRRVATFEQAKRIRLTAFKRFRYSLSRQMERAMRNSPLFAYLDNHHFVHHYRYYKNLNVVWPLADKVLRTAVPSHPRALDSVSNMGFWLCPNSPDTRAFAAPAQF